LARPALLSLQATGAKKENAITSVSATLTPWRRSSAATRCALRRECEIGLPTAVAVRESRNDKAFARALSGAQESREPGDVLQRAGVEIGAAFLETEHRTIPTNRKQRLRAEANLRRDRRHIRG
jgi:hypothetical protein